MLSELRVELNTITNTILNSIVQRSKLVARIQKEKQKIDEYNNFDLEREKIVFNEMILKISNFPEKEVLGISLLIESQANQYGHYPEWSKGEHLSSSPKNLSEMINPILLARYNKTSYDLLPINEKFKEILNPVME